MKVDTFAASAGGKIAERSNLLFANSVNYLPPNSIATATVIVGALMVTEYVRVVLNGAPVPVELSVLRTVKL